ncbi:MAG TPA: hypothetical protein VKT49_06990 [Bryobacteraceae bacterium]|nr:hypothetical protein [Bryobacteraceae bacterium]
MAVRQHARSPAPRRGRTGNSMVEMALVVAVSVPVLFGVAGLGIRLGRTLGATQVTRDVAHMYALGTDFSLSGTQAIARALSREFTLTSTGTGVLILSRIVKVDQTACDASGVPACPNVDQPVFAQRLVIGNAALRTSSFGTPPASYIDPQGNISSHDYCGQPALLANGFDSVLNLTPNQSAYLVEGYFSMPEISLSYFGSPGGGYYVRLIF